MSLKTTSKHSKAVFDSPQNRSAKKHFAIRRFLSLAGKAVLSKRNQPIQTNRDSVNQKCFTLSHIFKFAKQKLNKTITGKVSIKSEALAKNFNFNNKMNLADSKALSFLKHRLEPSHKVQLLERKSTIFFCNLSQVVSRLRIYDFKPLAESFKIRPEMLRQLAGTSRINADQLYCLNIQPLNGAFKSKNFSNRPTLEFRQKFKKITHFCLFKSINESFWLYPPAKTSFRLSPLICSANIPGNYTIASDFKISANRFANSWEATEPCNYDWRPEIGRNLVIEVNQKLKAWPGKFRPIQTIFNQPPHFPISGHQKELM